MTRAEIEREIRKNLEVIPHRLQDMRPNKISEREFADMLEGIETIQKIINGRPHLKSQVSFKSILDELVSDYFADIKGEKTFLLDNKIITGSRILNKAGTVYGSIPMLIDQLLNGIIQPEFRFKKSKKKNIPWRQFLEEIAPLGMSQKRIREHIENGIIPENLIEYGRERGRGREIISISREALEKIEK